MKKMKVRYIVYVKTLFLFLLLFCFDSASVTAKEFLQDLSQRDSFTGDWGGLRTKMEERGISIEVIYTGEIVSNVSGGIKNKTEYLDNMDLTLSVDAEKLIGWNGTSFFIYALGNQGGSPSENVGDAQGVSNIEAPDTLKIYEAWIQQNLFEDKLSLLGGLFDLNSEFDVIETAGLFHHASHGIGPDFSQSGLNGPSIFPTTSLGIRARVQPNDSFYVQAVALDGVPGDLNDPKSNKISFGDDEGFLLAAEMAYLTGTGEASDAPYGKFALGVWYYTEKFDDLQDIDNSGNPIKRSMNPGLYVLAERIVYREKDNPEQGLAVFGRFGIADSDIHQFDYYLGGGLVYTGLIPGRDEDLIGFAIANAHNGSKFKKVQQAEGVTIDDSEVALILSYLAQITPWFAIQPDLQYIINPGTDPAIGNAFVVGGRFEIYF